MRDAALDDTGKKEYFAPKRPSEDTPRQMDPGPGQGQSGFGKTFFLHFRVAGVHIAAAIYMWISLDIRVNLFARGNLHGKSYIVLTYVCKSFMIPT